MATSLRILIPKVERALSQSAGVSVQKYSQDRIADMIWDAFNLCFTKKWWPSYMTWETLTLDGTTGGPNADPQVKRFEDIRIAYPNIRMNRALRQTPDSINPFQLAGSDPLYIEGNITRVFRCWPLTSVATLYMHNRILPNEFALDDAIYLDEMMLKYYAAWQYSVDDGHNPAQAEKLLNLAETRYNQISDAMLSQPLDLDPRFPNTNTQWVEAP